MDEKSFLSVVAKGELAGVKLIIDLTGLRFVDDKHGVVRFEKNDGTPGLFGVCLELISGVRFPDAQGGGNSDAIKRALKDVHSLSLHPSVGRK